MKENYTIAQFSKLTGVTKRTLQYYDEIGLLKPTKRSNGYREYNTHNLLMLQQIVTLKYLGLPISKIATIIKAPESKIEATLTNQMHSLRSKARTFDKVAGLIEDTLIIKNQTQCIDWPIIIKAIRALQTDTESGWFHEFYTQEELLKLQEVWSGFSDEQVYVMVDWYTSMAKQLTEQALIVI